MKILILGLGNTLLSDEGVGVHVLANLSGQLDPEDDSLELLDGGTLSFTLAVPIAEADGLIVVDAAQLQDAPGALAVFEGEAMDQFLTGNRTSSVHEVGLVDLMQIARLTDKWPARRALVAIQPARVDWGEHPTDAVAAAVPEACVRIHDLLGAWRHAAA